MMHELHLYNFLQQCSKTVVYIHYVETRSLGTRLCGCVHWTAKSGCMQCNVMFLKIISGTLHSTTLPPLAARHRKLLS
jgi:hypothetical protein